MEPISRIDRTRFDERLLKERDAKAARTQPKVRIQPVWVSRVKDAGEEGRGAIVDCYA